MRRAAAILCLLSAGCGGGATAGRSGSTPSGPSLPTAATAADLAACVQDINNYRGRVGRRAYTESSSLESYAATSAQEDGASGTPHGHFISGNGGGVAFAENEFLRQNLVSYGTVLTLIQKANELFYSEGPGGGHYENLTNANYTQAGCGISIQNGLISIAEDFR